MTPSECAEAIQKDAARYRFLRSAESRDHNFHTERCLDVSVVDWGYKLGEQKPTSNFWSRMDVIGNAMDKAVDAAMRRKKGTK